METNNILEMLRQEHKRLMARLDDIDYDESNPYDSGWRDAYEWIISTIEQQVAIETISKQYQLNLFNTPDPD